MPSCNDRDSIATMVPNFVPSFDNSLGEGARFEHSMGSHGFSNIQLSSNENIGYTHPRFRERPLVGM